MPDTDIQEKKPVGFSELPIHAPIPIKQFESKFWNEYMAEQQVACVYTVSNLLHLGKTLPRLLCKITKFNACAFEGTLVLTFPRSFAFFPIASPSFQLRLCTPSTALARLLL
jgi:hypothetical protein